MERASTGDWEVCPAFYYFCIVWFGLCRSRHWQHSSLPSFQPLPVSHQVSSTSFLVQDPCAVRPSWIMLMSAKSASPAQLTLAVALWRGMLLFDSTCLVRMHCCSNNIECTRSTCSADCTPIISKFLASSQLLCCCYLGSCANLRLSYHGETNKFTSETIINILLTGLHQNWIIQYALLLWAPVVRLFSCVVHAHSFPSFWFLMLAGFPDQ